MNFLQICSLTFCEYNVLKLSSLIATHICTRTNLRFSTVVTTLQIRTAATIFALIFFYHVATARVDQGPIIIKDS